ncbi:MAG: efflux RND transporter periplasmic adaptor subunit [Caldilineaceae bacterium]|nr:efflux RND transporter periplasmic adaptor subunit [Caldilineaceae bacterium]
MRRSILLPVLIVIGLIALGGYVYGRGLFGNSALTLSGTIEATEINVPTIDGGQVIEVDAKQGDVVAQDQVLVTLRTTGSNRTEIVRSPISGTVLERLVEPSEFAALGSTLMVVADLDQLTLTIYVPEDRYGQVAIGQTFAVTVDSFPGESFSGTVSYISDHAEFTPRNVQTTDSRKTTVYAVKLNLAPSAGKLKPGMPADVHLDAQM